MSSFTSKTLLSALAGAVAVSAHGHVNHIVVDGVQYEGYDVFTAPYQNPAPVVVGWSETATDNGFVLPADVSGPDIVCHKNGANAKGHAVVAAGSSIMMQWDTWPESHHGPVIDYLANCGESCETVDKMTLEFFKIGEKGLIDGSSQPGRWATDVLMENNFAWIVDIPASIAPGNYVLRHEMIALHEGNLENGAQLYPQCVNIQVTGDGSDQPQGVLGTDLYEYDDAGIFFNIYQDLSGGYPIPGPALYDGAVADVEQTFMETTSTGTISTEQGLPAGAPAPGSATDPAPVAAPETEETPAESATPAPETEEEAESPVEAAPPADQTENDEVPAEVESPAETTTPEPVATPEPSAPEEATPKHTCTGRRGRGKAARRARALAARK